MSNREVTITRVLDAPRSRVFKAWLDPKQVTHWWGPNGFTVPLCEIDARPGGAFRIDMRGPDGTDYPGFGEFLEIVEPERIVTISRAILDEEGIPQLEVRTTVTFVEQDGKTTLTLHAAVIKASPAAAFAADGMEQGWSESLDRLANFISILPEAP